MLLLVSSLKPTPISSMAGEKNQKGNGPSNLPSQSDTASTNELVSTRSSWRKTFNEIKSLVVPVAKKQETNCSSQDVFGRWKAFLDQKYGFDAVPPSQRIGISDQVSDGRKKWGHAGSNSGGSNKLRRKRQRYDGFVSWEKLLQQWADDVTEYTSEPATSVDNTSNVSGDKNLEEGRETKEGAKPDRDGNCNVSLDSDKSISSGGSTMIQEKEGKDRGRKDVESDRSSLVSLRPSFLPFAPRPLKAGEPVVSRTDLSDKSKNIWIVTTASLPWMTGTAVNPLLRAAYMCTGRSSAGGSVTILLPWLERHADQTRVYGQKNVFKTRADQEEYVRRWLRDTADMKEASAALRIRWYTAWQERAENSIYSMGDITSLIPEDEADICVLEEPEHLNWYRAPGESWTEKFKHVVGIVHTNYFVYAQEQPAALIRAPAMRLLCSWMCRAHCHRVIKLSGTLQVLAPEKELVENVHGVRRTFLSVGETLRQKLQNGKDKKVNDIFGPKASPAVYFIGKMLWSKGIGSLMELVKYAEESAGLMIDVDMYGYGPDAEEAASKASRMNLTMKFHGPIDHAALAETHKIFINPSTSEVLCTTVAEALAMGKFAIVPSHPSNDFFAQFPNCLPYASKEEFVALLYFALTHSPEPLTDDYLRALSWEAATERFEAAGSISTAEAEALSSVLSAPEAGVEISLPPLIEDERRRKKVTRTLKKTRLRFRQFRSRLSQEVQESKVLPKDLQHRVVSELDKKLDIDLDTVLASPKLRLKLSAAELDKQLLELYNKVSQSPSGDVLRVVGGGTDVGKQNLYLRRQAMRGRKLTQSRTFVDGGEVYEEDGAAGLVRLSLKRNFPQRGAERTDMALSHRKSGSNVRRKGLDMCLHAPIATPFDPFLKPCSVKLK